MDWTVLLFVSALILGLWHRRRIQNLQDKSDGEPVLSEHARVHAKSSYYYHDTLRSKVYYLHFYIPERNYMVACKVHKIIWKYLKKGDRGILCHQGGTFFSFERDGEHISVDSIPGIHLDP